MQDTKRCPKCGETKTVGAFSFNLTGTRAGHIRSYCKACEVLAGVAWRRQMGLKPRNSNPVVDGMKLCSICNQRKPISEFYLRHGDREGEPYNSCKSCKNKRVTECGHKSGRWQPMNEDRHCSFFLGIHVAERVLTGFFDKIQRMPLHNPGFDFLCGKGFKIEVKSSCLRPRLKRGPEYWAFNIRGNCIADYFLLLAFDNRESLEPQHVWLIPSRVASHLKNLVISNVPNSLAKWEMFERPLDKVTNCCESMRSTA